MGGNGMKYAALIASTLASLAFPATEAVSEENLSDALLKGRPYIDARYRFEAVDQDEFTENAGASTLRTKIGFETKSYKGFSALLEGENVTTIGRQKFNDTVNGRTQFPVVADPEITELNQGYINYDGIFDTAFRIGRQRIRLDNQRFIGTVTFRQNEQTFDAVRITNKSLDSTTARYFYVDNVNRVLAPNRRSVTFGPIPTSSTRNTTGSSWALWSVTPTC